MSTVNKPVDLPTELLHHIDGKDVPSVDGATFGVADPVTDTEYGRVAAGGPADVDAAVAAARRAFNEGPWPRLSDRERAKVLNRIADAIESRADRLAELETFDTGLPVTQAKGQAHRAAENFRYFADVIVAQHEDAYLVGEKQVNYAIRQPAGVAGLITPWNTPFMLETWKLAPSLASGCTVVLKPAEWSPLSASLLPGIMAEAGVPDGVFNLVHGIGESAGAALVAHPDVPRLSFTGESGTGQIIMRTAAEHLKEVSMELGGKSPCVVFADADFDRAVDAAVFGVFSLNGERCTASSRVLVQREIYDRFVEALAARASAVRVGLPSDPSTEVGALIHPEHYARVMEYVEIGKQEARLVAGGSRPEHLPSGNFLSPTVFADVAPDARVFQEEIFGPVVCVTPFDTEEEAVALANATKYGLAGYVWTSDLQRGHRVARAVQSGMVWVNSHNVRDLRTPFGGIKASGVGREGGAHSIDFYSDLRAVHVAVGDLTGPRFGVARP
ncbi:5-carboxymethyl-2-hydroxymuconic-semialdehyde dehydrogenase [Saccharothrix tamanrassetensis]|uniref:5-carboxymethyl-2-hydroxymuconic-semialdehyde dehydrogenase n=1 Tax=Saccharothrix tamanrassetensis TaxID=1051531 RepID=A0A841CAL2_9PSEU|nr:5-carboxymethyl-2-hydroxymuconate semialdehyde dehydrogenase [Saccharothrix tamanrassetensis]MBB5953983.1 5-carboxymethyl-2-hydroxymuconic-semialdehyde dehydrogenase [Saccharothrix tamanrassetensis]